MALCHPREYIERIRKAVPQIGLVQLDDDTVLSAGSFEASLRAAGGAILAVDEVMTGKAKNAFVAIRPAGHHAEATTAMGFCLFNNAAIAVRHAQRRYSAERVAIVDFDAHHGNGSQQIFWSDRTVMYCSTHEMPLFPGTGSISERGEYDNVVNAPLRAGDGGETFREAVETAILPRLQEFGPDLIVISAGFDAHRLDPLANLNFSIPMVATDHPLPKAEAGSRAASRADHKILSLAFCREGLKLARRPAQATTPLPGRPLRTTLPSQRYSLRNNCYDQYYSCSAWPRRGNQAREVPRSPGFATYRTR
jgi:hypothetical protein